MDDNLPLSHPSFVPSALNCLAMSSIALSLKCQIAQGVVKPVGLLHEVILSCLSGAEVEGGVYTPLPVPFAQSTAKAPKLLDKSVADAQPYNPHAPTACITRTRRVYCMLCTRCAHNLFTTAPETLVSRVEGDLLLR